LGGFCSYSVCKRLSIVGWCLVNINVISDGPRKQNGDFLDDDTNENFSNVWRTSPKLKPRG
jgi:hypothetical protein